MIREVNLTVQAGEFVAVIGPSGCGKSTLLSLLAGYLLPNSGRVLFRGEPVAGRRERMMVFQQPALFPWLTTQENIAYGLKLKANRSDRRSMSQTARDCFGWCNSTGSRGTTRANCQVECVNGWKLPARWRSTRRFC